MACRCYPCIRACVEPFCRIWGIITTVVMWGSGTELSYHHHPLGAFILVSAMVVTILESAFVIDLFLRLWIRFTYNGLYRVFFFLPSSPVIFRDDDHCFLKFWNALMWLDLWKKSIFYVIIGSICFIHPIHYWLGTIPGGMLFILAIAYLFFTYKVKKENQDALLDSKSETYDRFDDIQDDLDDSLPEPDGNVCTQENILEV